MCELLCGGDSDCHRCNAECPCFDSEGSIEAYGLVVRVVGLQMPYAVFGLVTRDYSMASTHETSDNAIRIDVVLCAFDKNFGKH